MVVLPSGESVPCLGQGTWMMGERSGERAREVAALQLGIDLGMTLIDTAEMYADGGAEAVVAEAIAGRRDSVFVVSKVTPQNASRHGTIAACERSLRRLRIEAIDLYLLHWRGSVPLAETIEAFSRLCAAGKIRHWGVSNLDTPDMETVVATPGGESCAANQVLYNLVRRGIEWELLPWCRQRGIPIMAYSPIEQGRLTRDPKLRRLALGMGVAASTAALAWVLRQPDIIAIPKATSEEHLRANRQAHDLLVDAAAMRALDAAFPPPRAASSLEMI